MALPHRKTSHHAPATPGDGARAPDAPSRARVQAAVRAVAGRLSVPALVAERALAELEGLPTVPRHVEEHLLESPEATARILDAASDLPGAGPFAAAGDAVHALGAAGVRAVMRETGTHSVLDGTPGAAGMSPLAFAARSAEVARLARAAMPHVAPAHAPAGDAAWTAGLLHDIGAAVIMAAAGDPATAPADALRLADHPVVGAWLARRWRLPPAVATAIRHHEDHAPPADAVPRALWLAVRIREARTGMLGARSLEQAAASCGLGPRPVAMIAMGDEPWTAGVSRGGRGGDAITAREHEVLQLLAEGLVPKQIAQALACAPSTVHNHLHHVYRKLGVGTQAQALLEARARGLV